MIEEVFGVTKAYNTLIWHGDEFSISRESATHVRISRQKPKPKSPFAQLLWSVSLDVTSGYQELTASQGNRLVSVADKHLLALTCGTYADTDSEHNHHIYNISDEGQVLWSLPWKTINRFALLDDNIVVIKHNGPSHVWLADPPLEAHLIDPHTGQSISSQSILIPDNLKSHLQSFQLTKLRTYLVWKNQQLLLYIRPDFRAAYSEEHNLQSGRMFSVHLTF